MAVPRRNGLYSLEWRRVVLDEGHNIRNPKAKIANVAFALLAKSRWVLTGTPIVNNLRDLYSHVKFLRLTGGLEQEDVFSGTHIRPLSSGSSEASILQQALISTLCRRRMKDMKFINLRLPQLSSHKYTVTFLPHERRKYDALQQEAQGLLEQHQRKNAKGENTYSREYLPIRSTSVANSIQTCWRFCFACGRHAIIGSYVQIAWRT